MKEEMENVLKGKKYVLVEWPNNQSVIDYLEKFKPEVYKECYPAEDAAWFIPMDAMDHIIGKC